MDGKIIIGTEIDTKKLEKQLEQLEREQTRLKDKKLKLDLDETKALNNLKKVDNQLEALNDKIAEFESNNIPELRAESIEYQEMVSQREQINAKGEEYLQKLNIIKSAQADINNQLELNMQSIDNVKNSLNGIPINIGKINSSLKNVVKTVAKWSLAVFGIRGAYMAVRNAINTISQDDKQLASDIDYMKRVLAYTLEPIVRAIVNLMQKLTYYVAYIIKVFTGRNIFEEANKNLKGANKSAKELSKTMASFDEMNVLSDSSSGGGGSAGTPSFDYSALVNEAPSIEAIIQKLTDKWITFGEEMKYALDNPDLFKQAYGNWGLFFEGVTRMFYGLWEAITGTVEIFGGVMDIIVGIFTGDIDLIKSGFQSFVQGFARIFEGLLNIIKGALQFVFGFVLGIFGDIWDGIKKGAVDAWEGIKSAFSSVVSFFNNLWSKVKSGLKSFGTKVGEIIGSAFKTAFNGIMKVIENFLNTPIKAINGLIDVINAVPGINLGKLTEFKLPRLAQGGIVNNPGNGVMMGNYIAGERGPEAVIPLDDATLDRLGLAFARHTTINATIPVYAYNRQVAREIRKIEADQSFASNR